MAQWFQHALDRRPWQTQQQAFALVMLSFVVALIIGGLYLAQAAASSTTGRQLEDLIVQRNQLEQVNEEIRSEIAIYQSVPRLRERALQLGFYEAGRDDIEYIIVPGYNPSEPQVAAAPTQVPLENIPVYDETFLGWLQQQWDAFSRQRPTVPTANEVTEGE